jgi:thioredoxin 1
VWSAAGGGVSREWEESQMIEEVGGPLVEITDANFGEEIESNTGLAIVDFWAEWCGPCRLVGPIVDELAQENATVKVGKLDVEANPDTAFRFNVRSIPSILFFKDGELVDTVIGAQPKSVLERKIEQNA